MTDQTVIEWDWKEQIPVDVLQAAINEGKVNLMLVPDTYSDQIALIAAKTPCTRTEAQAYFDDWLEEEAKAEEDE